MSLPKNETLIKEYKQKLSKARIGKKLSEETKRKISKANKGRIPTKHTILAAIAVNTGRIKSEEEKRKISISQQKRYEDNNLISKIKDNTISQWSNMTNTQKVIRSKKLRIAAIKNIEKGLKDGNSMTPMLGRNEKQILDFLEKSFGYTILRQHNVAGYFLDGYCPALRLAIEIDESYHNKQIEKDQLRQNNIINELNCQFLRLRGDL